MRMVFFLSMVLFAIVNSPAAEPLDLSRSDRKITKEPEYTAKQPLYGLVVIGPDAKKRYWMVLDKSSADNEKYDVVYVDFNGNGDLTEPTEKVTAKSDGSRVRFQFPDVIDLKTGIKHTGFNLSIADRDPATQMASLLWKGEHKFGGGYPENPDNGYFRFGSSPEIAPILWMNGDGPFRFQRWYSGELRIGEADDFKVFLGVLGVGQSSFCAFQHHVLPEDEPVVATLIYNDKDGKERRVKSVLEDRC